MTDTLADYAARGTAILPQPWNLVALAVAATLAALLLHWVVFRLLLVAKKTAQPDRARTADVGCMVEPSV